MEQTSLEELKRTAASGAYRRIPIWREIFSDIATPVQVLKKLLAVSDHSFLLESAEDNKQWGRYSFLGFDPAMELTCTNHQITITTDHVEQVETENPAQVIAKVIEENRAPQIKKLPPLTGGLVGYFAYDYIKYAEPTLRLDAEDQEKFRDVDLMLFDKMIAFDHYRQKIILICNSRVPEAGQAAAPDALEAVYRAALQTLDQMQDIIEKGAEKNVPAGRLTTELTPLFDQESYCEKVEQVKHYIHEGDIFQLVLSNRLEAGFDGSLLDTYRILRTKNPSPYMFYFSSDDLEIAGASPETLVKVDNQTAYTFPLAGTRPRGKDEKEDQELEADLLSDEKELAQLEDLYEQTTGEKMAKFYRPPQGKYSDNNLQLAKELGYRTIFWSLAYVDWKQEEQPTHEEAMSKLLKRVHPGAIVLLHNTSRTNGEILDEVLTKWEEMGYHFASLEELVSSGGREARSFFLTDNQENPVKSAAPTHAAGSQKQARGKLTSFMAISAVIMRANSSTTPPIIGRKL